MVVAPRNVLIVGGYGVFGSRLARLLLPDAGLKVWIAGRSLAAAQAFCKAHGGTPVVLDRLGDLVSVFAQVQPYVVIDAAGPFQQQGLGDGDRYRLAKAAVQAGAHYLDLSDDATFTSGITVLNTLAVERGLAAISGASSVPAISSAAVDQLRRGMVELQLIDTVILPGNRAPRGLSVVRAILLQAGLPLALWRGQQWQGVPGWSGLKRVSLQAGAASLPPRWASFIGCPDLALFPAHYGARSVLFRAGLELPLLHLGLWLLAWLPRLKLLRSLGPLAPAMRWLADRFIGWGSDRGGMGVAAVGRNARGESLRRSWTLLAEAGDGPFIPAIPAAALVHKLLRGGVPAGARPCLGTLTLAEVEAGLQGLKCLTAVAEQAAPCLYEQVLGDDWQRLAPALRALHDVQDCLVYQGQASVENGRHWLARLLRRAFGFPPTAAATPVQVTLQKTANGERWTRQFGRHCFHSNLSLPGNREPGVVCERFGPMRFRIKLPVDAQGLQMPVQSVRFLGIPLLPWLRPDSITRETVDADGRFCFDVAVHLPLAGLMVRYQGYLQAVRGDASAMAG